MLAAVSHFVVATKNLFSILFYSGRAYYSLESEQQPPHCRLVVFLSQKPCLVFIGIPFWAWGLVGLFGVFVWHGWLINAAFALFVVSSCP